MTLDAENGPITRPISASSAAAPLLRRAATRAEEMAPSAAHAARTKPETGHLAALLLARGHVTLAQMTQAQTAHRGTSLSLGQVLLTQGLISEAELLSALSEIYSVGIAETDSPLPDHATANQLPADRAIAAEAVIWRTSGSALVVATSRPDRFDLVRAAMGGNVPLLMVLASRAQILSAQRQVYGRGLAREAEGRAPEAHSCRAWRGEALARAFLGLAGLVALGLVVAPHVVAVAAFGLALVVFALNCALKIGAALAALRRPMTPADPPAESRFLHLPTMSIIVPLFREPEIAGALVERLRRLDYPRERLDILLAVEEDDPLTMAALRTGRLPPWMRAIVVPRGAPQTKPRALNYALRFARGDIIGIYDAEDRPDPDQLHRVVQRFAEVPPEVACLQGRLDYYNARHNWLSRMFTVEYASWFRVMLPGVQRLGLVVPLGGTTLFLRRNVVEEVGAWDAHNVTEDAELGLRLARAGYTTEIVDTTTFEEANAATLPWIRQRSRWLKGYLMTWGSAMRSPLALWRDLGPWRFLGLQVQFIGAVLGFLLAPLLWSFSVKMFGLWHPMDAVLGPTGYLVTGGAMLSGLLLSIAVSLYACRAAHLRHLRPIAPLVEPYYLLGTVAAWIGLFEVMARPFFWAKTTHGAFGGAQSEANDAQGPAKPRLHAAE